MPVAARQTPIESDEGEPEEGRRVGGRLFDCARLLGSRIVAGWRAGVRCKQGTVGSDNAESREICMSRTH